MIYEVIVFQAGGKTDGDRKEVIESLFWEWQLVHNLSECIQGLLDHLGGSVIFEDPMDNFLP